MAYNRSPQSSAARTFFWHDFETTGTHKQLDRPTQFAGIRTDEDLNIIGEPVMLYCRPSPEIIPHPMAVGITGITPQECEEKGLIEADFAAAVLQQLGMPGTCGVGYNTITFDDEITRNLLFRNFQDPYAREWQNGNSRFDLLVTARMCCALRPEGINWPVDEDGKVSVRLEKLAKANHLKQERAHDALSDVEATIGLARLIREKQRGLYDYTLGLRNKHTVANLLALPITSPQSKPLVHVASFYPRERGFTAIIGSLGEHPTQSNARLIVDLTADLSQLLTLDTQGIADRLFGGKVEENDGKPVRLPVSMIQINKVPGLTTMGAFRPASENLPGDRERLGYTDEVMNRCRENLALLRANPQIVQTVNQAFRILSGDYPTPADPELAIYDGFANNSDKALMTQVQRASPEALKEFAFTHPKYNELLFRYRARNFSHSLDETEKARWDAHRRERLISGGPTTTLTVDGFREALAETRARPDMADKQALFDDLSDWVEALVKPLTLVDKPELSSRARPSP